MAFNAGVYPYALDPVTSVSLYMYWWTDECIEKTVTEKFILSKLQPKDQINIKTHLAFGESLTDDSYLDWILRRTKRIFLILVDLGIQEQIFSVVDDFIEDEDLPLSGEALRQLPISSKHDAELRGQFYRTQYKYLVRHVTPRTHVHYDPDEIVPINVVPTRAQAPTLQNWTRVMIPGQGRRTFVRRWFPLNEASKSASPGLDFRFDVETQDQINHPHIADIWASFTLGGGGCTISSFVAEHTLKSYLEQRSHSQFSRLAKEKRQKMLLQWCHCLADAVSKMHLSGICHSSIRPSNIVINSKNEIAFSDIGSLTTFQKDKRPDEKEAYMYAAPEIHFTAPEPVLCLKRRKSTFGALNISTKALKGISHFHLGRSPTAQESDSGPLAHSPPISPTSHEFQDRYLARVSGSISTTSSTDASASTNDSTISNDSELSEAIVLPRLTEKADVFSLGCVLLDILSQLMKKKPCDAAKFRSHGEHKGGLAGHRHDSSFHANITQVQIWITMLEDEAKRKKNPIYKSVPDLLALIRTMLDSIPGMRPSAYHVQQRIYQILKERSGMAKLYCSKCDIPSDPYHLLLANSKNPQAFSQEPAATEPVKIMSDVSLLSPRPSHYDVMEEGFYDFF